MSLIRFKTIQNSRYTFNLLPDEMITENCTFSDIPVKAYTSFELHYIEQIENLQALQHLLIFLFQKAEIRNFNVSIPENSKLNRGSGHNGSVVYRHIVQAIPDCLSLRSLQIGCQLYYPYHHHLQLYNIVSLSMKDMYSALENLSNLRRRFPGRKICGTFHVDVKHPESLSEDLFAEVKKQHYVNKVSIYSSCDSNPSRGTLNSFLAFCAKMKIQFKHLLYTDIAWDTTATDPIVTKNDLRYVFQKLRSITLNKIYNYCPVFLEKFFTALGHASRLKRVFLSIYGDPIGPFFNIFNSATIINVYIQDWEFLKSSPHRWMTNDEKESLLRNINRFCHENKNGTRKLAARSSIMQMCVMLSRRGLGLAYQKDSCIKHDCS